MDKKAIRKKMLELRKQLSNEKQVILSDLIAEKLFLSEIYLKNSNICLYQSFRGEVLCDKIKEQAFRDGKNVFVPITNLEAHCIEFYQVFPDTIYQEGAYGIAEPVLECQNNVLKDKALILMPGLAFDRDKHRIGYGGGYYDRYLETHPCHTTVALCYGFQIVDEELPYEEYDVLPDYVLTELELI